MTGRFSILLVLRFLLADPAAAQTINLSPSDPKRWDATVSIGWLGGNKEGLGDRGTSGTTHSPRRSTPDATGRLISKPRSAQP